ncbi:lipopolysaccharide biosynthesis protein [Fictibacillus iocasae]|uniref:Lipopolysaccharide biosynthesis protein n=1 Tax=Fictibacillus iocasae TaxID=2715437 RepID=A0ABW2NR56_9BACL
MLAQLKRLGGDSLLYALMNVGTKLIAFLMLPIFTAYLGKEQMGVLENIDSFTSMLTFLVIFGTDSALAFYYFDTKNRELKMSFVQTVLQFRLAVAMLCLLVAAVGGEWMSLLITKESGHGIVILAAMVTLVLESVITLVLTYYRYEFKAKKVVIYTVIRLGAAALLAYLFLRMWSEEVDVIYFGRNIAAGFIVLLLLPDLFKLIRIKVDKEQMKAILKYAAPLVPASLAFWIIATSNRFILTYFEGVGSAGLYGVAVKFATVITLLTSSVQMAWRPYTMSIKDRPDAKKIFSKFYLIILLGGIIGLLGIATFIPYIFKFMISNPEFHSASQYIALLSAGTFLNFYYLIISVGLFIKKETKIISVYFGAAAALSFVLNVTLIPLLSQWGAALAVTISYLFATVMIFIRSQKTYYVPVPVGKMITLFLAGMAAMGVLVWIHNAGLPGYYLVFPWLFFAAVFGASRVLKEIKS